MNKHAGQIYIPEEDSIDTGENEPRMCDYCNVMLIDEYGTARQTAYLTDFGLFCGDCIGTNIPQTAYLEGDSVIGEDWY
jgi:hypothetical protein